MQPRKGPLQHTIMLLDSTKRFSLERKGIQGNREYFVIASAEGNQAHTAELSIYEPGTFTGGSRLLGGHRVKIVGPAREFLIGYFLADGHILGWHWGDTWFVLRSHTPGDARKRLLSIAGQIGGTGGSPYRVPFSVGYRPAGFSPSHALHLYSEGGAETLGMTKGAVGEEAQLSFTVKRLLGKDNAHMRQSLGKPDSTAHGREVWFTKMPSAAEIVVRTGDCFAHIIVRDVALIPRAEQEKLVNGFILGNCGDTTNWAYPFAGLS